MTDFTADRIRVLRALCGCLHGVELSFFAAD